MTDAILVNHFSSAPLARAVDSVLAQGGVNVWIVDNSADDEEWARLQRFASDGVRLVRSETNVGFGRACSLAYAAGRDPYVLLLNPDAWLADGALAALAVVLDRDAVLGAVGPRIWWNRPGGSVLAHSVLPTPARTLGSLAIDALGLTSLRRALFRRKSTAIWRAGRGVRPISVGALSGAALLLRRHAVDRSGGLFDPRFFMFYEDSDLCLRLRRAGWRLAVEPAADAVHAYRHAAYKAALGERSERQYWEKHWPGGRWQAAREWLMRRRRAPATVDADLGESAGPWRWSVPDAWRGGWRFEWSPEPSGVPMVACAGEGEAVSFAAEDWENLAPGEYWGRLLPLGPPLAERTCRWRVAASEAVAANDAARALSATLS